MLRSEDSQQAVRDTWPEPCWCSSDIFDMLSHTLQLLCTGPQSTHPPTPTHTNPPTTTQTLNHPHLHPPARASMHRPLLLAASAEMEPHAGRTATDRRRAFGSRRHGTSSSQRTACAQLRQFLAPLCLMLTSVVGNAMGRLQVLPCLPGMTSKFSLLSIIGATGRQQGVRALERSFYGSDSCWVLAVSHKNRLQAQIHEQSASTLFPYPGRCQWLGELPVADRWKAEWRMCTFIELVQVMSQMQFRWEQCVGPQA